MAYDRMFNNTMAIWAAFGGEIVPSLELGWIKLYASTFGFTGTSGSDYFSVYDNGNACIVISRGTRNHLTRSYYDKTERAWKNISFSPGQYYKSIIAAQNGVFLCADTFNIRGYIYTSKDGKNWINTHHTSYGNIVMCGATNGIGGVTSRWYVYAPVFIKSNINTGGAWTMVGTYYKDDMLCYTNMTYHKDRYVGIAPDPINDGTHKGGLLISTNGGASWQRQIQFPKNQSEKIFSWIDVRSVHGKLFVESYGYTNTDEHHYYIGLMNDSASDYRTVLHTSDSSSSDSSVIPHLSTMIYVDSLGMYMMFAKNILYYSYDGANWKTSPQKNFNDGKSTAIYIPGDGFYVGCGSSYVYYAPYP